MASDTASEQRIRELQTQLDAASGRLRELEGMLQARPPLDPEPEFQSRIWEWIEDPLSIIGRDHVYRKVSRSYERFFARSADAIIGSHVAEVLGQEQYAGVARQYLDRCLQGETVNYEGWFQFPGLGRRYMNVTYSPLRDRSGDVRWVLNVSRDVTDTKELELATLRERDRLSNILASLKTGLVLIDRDFTVVWANEYIRSLFPEAEPEGALCHQLLQTNEGCCMCPAAATFQTGECRQVEFFHQGMQRWFSVFSQPLPDSDGHVRHVLNSITDITQRKHRDQELEQSRQRFRLALEANRAGIWDADLRTEEVHFSPEWCEMLGLQEGEIPQGFHGWRTLVHPDDLPGMNRDYAAYLQGQGQGQDDGGLHLEYRLKAADGRWIWVRNFARITARDDQGRPTRLGGISMDITHERGMRERLRHSEQTYREIFDATTDAILLHDVDDLRIVDANRAAQELFGHDRKTLRGMGVSDISLDDPAFSHDQAREVVRSLPDSGMQPMEWCFKKRSGQHFWADLRLKKVEIGGQKRILASLRDITLQLRTRKNLEEREQTLHSILEAAPVLICLVNQTTIVWSNRQVREMLGYSPKEVEGASLKGFFCSQDDFSQISQHLMKQLFALGRGAAETELRHKSGHTVPVAMNLAPLDKSAPTREAICIIADISQRKQWERAVLEREARYADIFNNAPVGILRTTFEGEVLHLNQALASMLGHGAPAEAMAAFGKDILDVYSDPARREVLKRELRRHRFVKDFEVEWRNSAGELKTVSLNLRFIEERGRECIDGFVTDITEKRRAELENRERERQLIQADKLISLGILTSGVTHEINNPNNFIAMNAPMLEKAWQDLKPVLDEIEAERGDFKVGNMPYSRIRQHIPRLLEGIASGSRRIKDIVEGMKRFVRPEISGPLEEVDVNLVIETALPLVKARLNTIGAELQMDLDESLPGIRGSAQQIEQVLLNLLLNAMDAMSRTSGALLVRTRLSADAEAVEIMVRDEGEGLPEVDAAQLFTPFFTTKRDTGGTGLGLAISQRIVQIHGGSLELANNASGPGVTALVTLPLSSGPQE